MTHPSQTGVWRYALLVAWVLLAPAWLLSCSATPDSPEARIRTRLARAEVAAGGRDLAAFRQLVSDSYTDDHGHNKQAILGILAYHFFRNQSIHLLTRTQAITFPKPGQAEATVFVATAGQPIPGTEDLARLRADMFRFDLVLTDEGKGTWKVTHAKWRRVKIGDFL